MKARKISWKPQPHGSRLCGQTCVAMLAKCSLKRAIEVCGRGRRGTRVRDLVHGLQALGVEIKGKRLVATTGRNMPRRCLQRVRLIHYSSGNTFGHWRIRWDGLIYDPQYGVSMRGGKPSEAYWSRVISYLEPWSAE